MRKLKRLLDRERGIVLVSLVDVRCKLWQLLSDRINVLAIVRDLSRSRDVLGHREATAQ